MTAPPAQASALGKWGGLVLLAILAAGGAAGGTYFITRSKPEKPTEHADSKPGVKAVIHLEGFLVNLADTEQNRFLRVGIELGLDKELPKSGKGEGPAVSTPLIRDLILGVLTTWQSGALLAPDGKAKLKDQLLQEFKQKAPELGVVEIYFTDFLVQL